MDLYENTAYLTDLETAALAVQELSWFSGKTVLVTGASGLIGSTIIDVLLRANEISNLGLAIIATGRSVERLRKRFKGAPCVLIFEELDVNKPIELDCSVDVIVHAASNADPASITSDPVGTIDANVAGTERMLAWGKKHGCSRFLYISSGEVYGQMPEGINAFCEWMQGYVDPRRLRSCYPLAKRMAENLCVSFAHQHGISCISVRLCHTFGVCASARDTRAHEQFIRSALAGEDITLRSRGEQIRSYLYAADAASAILTVLTKGSSGQSYNVSSNESTSIVALARLISDTASVSVRFEIPSNSIANDTPISRQVLDPALLFSLGWAPAFSLSEGVRHVLSIRRSLVSEGNKDVGRA